MAARTKSTFLQMQDRVLTERFDPTAYRTRVKQWLNDAAERIARRALIPDLAAEQTVTLAISAFSFAVPDDFARSVYLIPTDDPTCGLDWVENPLEVRRMRLEMGRPSAYTKRGSNLLVAPTPTAALQLEHGYQRLPTPMVLDADTTELPESYVDLLETYATARGYRSEEDHDEHDKWMADFNGDLGALKVDLQDESNDGPDVVPGTF